MGRRWPRRGGIGSAAGPSAGAVEWRGRGWIRAIPGLRGGEEPALAPVGGLRQAGDDAFDQHITPFQGRGQALVLETAWPACRRRPRRARPRSEKSPGPRAALPLAAHAARPWPAQGPTTRPRHTSTRAPIAPAAAARRSPAPNPSSGQPAYQGADRRRVAPQGFVLLAYLRAMLVGVDEFGHALKPHTGLCGKKAFFMSVYDQLQALNIDFARPGCPCRSLSAVCANRQFGPFEWPPGAQRWPGLARSARRRHQHRRRPASGPRIAIELMGTLQAACGGDLNRVKRIVKVMSLVEFHTHVYRTAPGDQWLLGAAGRSLW